MLCSRKPNQRGSLTEQTPILAKKTNQCICASELTGNGMKSTSKQTARKAAGQGPGPGRHDRCRRHGKDSLALGRRGHLHILRIPGTTRATSTANRWKQRRTGQDSTAVTTRRMMAGTGRRQDRWCRGRERHDAPAAGGAAAAARASDGDGGEGCRQWGHRVRSSLHDIYFGRGGGFFILSYYWARRKDPDIKMMSKSQNVG